MTLDSPNGFHRETVSRGISRREGREFAGFVIFGLSVAAAKERGAKGACIPPRSFLAHSRIIPRAVHTRARNR